MKLSLIIDDEAWFWVHNPETWVWEAWYENGDLAATRAEKLDRPRTEDIVELIKSMALTAQGTLAHV